MPEHLQLRASATTVFGVSIGPEAAVAAAVVRRAERAAAGLRHRAEARRAVRDHHADVAARACTRRRRCRRDRGPAAVQERGDHLEQLALVDRAAAQLEVDAARAPEIGVDVASVEMYSGEA